MKKLIVIAVAAFLWSNAGCSTTKKAHRVCAQDSNERWHCWYEDGPTPIEPVFDPRQGPTPSEYEGKI